MKVNKIIAFTGILAILLVTLVLLPGGCTATKEKVVKIGEIIDLTGPTSDAGQEMHQAYEDNVRWLNEVEGGFNGIKAELVWYDTGYSTARAVSAYKRGKEQGVVFFYNWAAGDADALKPSLEADRIPMLTSGASPTTIYPPGWIYTSQTAYADNFTGFMRWLKQSWKESRPVKVALLGFDNAFGRAPNVAARKYGKENNVEIVGEFYFSPASMDFTSEVTRLRESGADYAFISASQIPVSGILRDAQKIGILGKLKFVHGTSASPAVIMRLAGPLTEGLLFANDQAIPSEDNIPGIKRIKEMHLKYQQRPLPEAENVYTQTWIRSQLLFEGIRKAISKVGFDGLTGSTIKDGLDSIKDFDLMGIAPKMSFNKDDPRGQEHIRIVEYRGGKLTPISDWFWCDYVKPD